MELDTPTGETGCTGALSGACCIIDPRILPSLSGWFDAPWPHAALMAVVHPSASCWHTWDSCSGQVGTSDVPSTLQSHILPPSAWMLSRTLRFRGVRRLVTSDREQIFWVLKSPRCCSPQRCLGRGPREMPPEAGRRPWKVFAASCCPRLCRQERTGSAKRGAALIARL